MNNKIGGTNKQSENSNDRFQDLADNYGNLFIEVFRELGMDYEKLERSVFEAVSAADPDFKRKAILDIGCGDGSTIKPFLEAGCNNLTGLDLNPQMLKQAEYNFHGKVKLIQADAKRMPFAPQEFPIIISGEAIHNIPKEERKLLWKEILRLKPEIFVNTDKMVARTEEEQKKCYNDELEAIRKIFLEKYGLEKAYKGWVKHYEDDDRERLTPEEIEEFLGQDYDIKVTYEEGMLKTIIATRKN